MKTSPHISFEKLADMVEDRITADERASWLDHLAECTRCAEDFERLGHVLQLMRTDDSKDAPRDLLAYAKGLFSVRASSDRSILRRIVAALTFDSLTASPEFGVRSSETSTRQLIYSAEDGDLDLRLTPQGDRWLVMGQLLSPNCSEGHVEIKSESASASAALNEFCEFVLPPVAAGRYSLILRLPHLEIEVPRLDI
jgi:hypothetical protein